MKRNNIGKKIFGITSILLLIYCLIVFILLKIKLIPQLTEVPKYLETLGGLTIVALFIIGLYHLFLLSQSLKTMNVSFVSSVFVVLIIMSGIFLLSDLALLSDIGKEYLLSEASDEFNVLFCFTALHAIVIVLGVFGMNKVNINQRKRPSQDVMYITVHQIGVICGILGLFGIILAEFSNIVPERFTIQLIITLAVIAIVPLGFYVVYWVIRLKNKKIKQWWDEKNIKDSAISALITLVISIAICIGIIITQLCASLSNSTVFWIMVILFTQIGMYSCIVVLRCTEYGIE